MLKKKRSIIYFLLVITSVIFFVSFLHPTFYVDESYTIGLIQHSYRSLLQINSLDVHTPTYYLILKAFINVTTFWTKSIFIKVIFGHILSLIAFIVSFIALHKIVKMSHVNISWKLQLIIYLLFYSVCLYSVDLRMYGLSSLFNILEFYELIKLNNEVHNNGSLILMTLFAIIASYMDYFSALCAGMFILISFIRNIYNSKVQICKKLFMSGLILLISSIPLFILVIKQASLRVKYTASGMAINNIIPSYLQSFVQSPHFALILVIGFIVPILWSLKHLNSSFNFDLIQVLFNYLISNTIAIIACFKMNTYEPKIMYSQFSIYSFLISSVIIIALKKYSKSSKFHLIIIGIILVMLCGTALGKTYLNIKQYDISSIRLIKDFNIIKSNRNKNIQINYDKLSTKYLPNDDPKSMYLTQLSVYVQNYHKNIIIRKKHLKSMSEIVNGNTKLFEKTFNNIKYN